MTDYDAIVVGSGSGGLTAALALARSGQRVAVFEQHSLPGGYSQSFSIEGHRFSPGIHYIGQLGEEGGLRRIYEGLGLANDLVFLELDPDGYDRVFVGKERFSIPKGQQHFEERLKQRFPRETKGIETYMRLVHRMSEELRWSTAGRSLRETLMLPLRMPTILRHGLQPLGRFLERHFEDPLLRAILSIQAGDHGMAPAQAPTVLHAGLQSYYFAGACYPRGGGGSIPAAFVKQLSEHGSEVFLGSEVASILIEQGHAKGVRLADGNEVRAGLVISNADPGVTWGRLVSPEHLTRRLRRRLARLEFSLSTLSLFLAVDLDLRAAGIDSGNIWYSRTTDIDATYRVAQSTDLSNLREIPGLFFNATTLKDPSMREDALHTVEAITFASHEAFARWQDTQPSERPEEYKRLKDHLTERMLDAIEQFVPGFRSRVVFRALATPLTNAHYLHTTQGNIYGTENSLRNLGPLSFPVHTHIEGLYQCGASTIAPGIHGVTRSGLAAAAAAMGCPEEELLTATGQELRIFPSEAPETWPEALRPARLRGAPTHS